jgi:diaminopimelate decarboxylase
MKNIRFQGYHFHIGTGIRDPRDYGKALGCLPLLIGQANSFGWPVACVDIGGGFASETTREFTTREFLLYQGFERLPEGCRRTSGSTFNDFASEISWTILKCFSPKELPELLFEPGRCIASPNQLLLLTVHRVKERPGLKKWLVTDGGLGTVTLPTFYEYHEIFLANDVFRSRTEKVTIIGPVCFASDIVYRNKRMPRIVPGEVIAVMDSGAYFTALESSFGFARPAMVAVTGRGHRLVRRAETFEDLVSRDVLNHFKEKEVSHEIYGH